MAAPGGEGDGVAVRADARSASSASSRPPREAARFRDERITMSHGAGGKATQTLIEGAVRARLRISGAGGARRLRGGRGRGLDLALATDSFVVKPLRFPGGSIGELAVNGTVNDLAVAGARPLARASRSCSRRARGGRAARGGRGGRGGGGARWRSWPATPRSSSAGTPTGCTSARPVWGAATRAPSSRRPGCSPATACSCRARSASTAPRSCWRGVSSSSKRRSCRTPARCGRGGRAAGRGRRRGCCACAAARGGGLGAERARARLGRCHPDQRGRRAGSRRGGRGLRAARDRPDVRGQRRQARGDRRARGGAAALAALRRVAGCEDAADIGEVGQSRAMVLVDTAFGGRRVMDLLAGDPLPRIC